MTEKYISYKYAFSLVELSIVLVILGLLVGGVLTGRSLIHAAELRAVSTEYTRYFTAVQSFRDKYFALPGDMNNAASFWGAADGSTGNTAGCATTAGTGTQTCNGNGNGVIENAASSSNEAFRFWQQLANVGLISGNYVGITQGTTNSSATATNSPASKLANGYWYSSNLPTQSANGNFFDGTYGNYLALGGLVTNQWPYVSLFIPEELWNIDTKLDDGKPATGKIVAAAVSLSLAFCTNASGTNAQISANMAADYNLTVTVERCILFARNLY
mgnify:CR=1 FL=1